MSRNENHGQMNSRKNDLKHKMGIGNELYFTLHLTTKTHTTHVSPHHTDTATSTPNPTYLHPTHVHEATCSESIRVWASPASPPLHPLHPLSPPVFMQLLRSTPSARAAPLCRYVGFPARARPPPPVPPPFPTRGREGCAPTHSDEDDVPADTFGVEGRREMNGEIEGEIEGEGEEGRPRSETC